MANATDGFCGTDTEVFYLALGRAWIVATPDRDDTPVEIDPADIPADATSLDGIITPAEALDYCRQIEAGFGVKLIDD